MVICAISGLFCFGAAAANFLFWDAPRSGYFLLTASLLCTFCLPLLFRFTQSLKLTGHAMGLMGIVLLSWDPGNAGGDLYSSTMLWFLVPPLVVMLVSGVRGGLIWGGVCVLSVAYIWWAKSPSPGAVEGLRTPALESAALWIGVLTITLCLWALSRQFSLKEKRSSGQIDPQVSLLPDETKQVGQAQSALEEPPLEGSLPASTNPGSYEPENTRGMRALLVEDHDLNRELLLEMLALSGFESLGASSAEKALVLLGENLFDVVLTDLHMPGMDGAKLTREWRKIEVALGRQPVRIVGISADVRVQERQRCISAGMNGFLGKPFSLADLRKVLAETKA
jgi:CheY-like chemotaxis protein